MTKAPARKEVARKPTAETAALKALRAAMADFADIEVARPAVRPDGVTMRAIRKAVREYYRDPKAIERAQS